MKLIVHVIFYINIILVYVIFGLVAICHGHKQTVEIKLCSVVVEAQNHFPHCIWFHVELAGGANLTTQHIFTITCKLYVLTLHACTIYTVNTVY